MMILLVILQLIQDDEFLCFSDVCPAACTRAYLSEYKCEMFCQCDFAHLQKFNLQQFVPA